MICDQSPQPSLPMEQVMRRPSSIFRRTGPCDHAADDLLLLEKSQVEMAILRTYSLPVGSASQSPDVNSPAATRITFPFKPASRLLQLQTSTTIDTDGIPTVNHEANTERSSGHDDACHLLVMNFQLRPVVPVLTLDPPLRSCASIPIDVVSRSENKPPEPPDWLVSDMREKSIPPFPISIDSPTDRNCWWLQEMTRAVKRNLSTVVQVNKDEIECVESEGSEIDVIEEVPRQESTQRPQAGKGNIPTIDITRESPPFSSLKISHEQSQREYSPDDLLILEGNMKDLRKDDLDSGERAQVEKLLRQAKGGIKVDSKMEVTTKGEGSCSAQDDSKDEVQQSTLDHIRRTTVAITGGTLTVAGVVLIPCPIIPGALVVYGGLMVLATEFDSARRALDTVKEPLERWLADDDEREGANVVEEERYNSRLWEKMIGYKRQDDREERKHDIDVKFMKLVDMRRSNFVADCKESGLEGCNAKPAKNNAMKQFFRKILIGDDNKENEDVSKDERNGKTALPGSDTSNNSTAFQSCEPTAPLSPSCHSVISPLSPSCNSVKSGCRFLSFEYGDDEDAIDDHVNSSGEPHPPQPNISLSRLCSDGSVTLNSGGEHRLYSDGSITLNTINNDFDENDCSLHLFSRQNSVEGSSYDNVAECLGMRFGDCDALVEEGCHAHGRVIEGCRPDGVAIEGRR